MVKVRELNTNFIMIDSFRKKTKIGTLRKLTYENGELYIQCPPVIIKQIKGDLLVVIPNSELRECMFSIQDRLKASSNSNFVPFIVDDLFIKITKNTVGYNKDKQKIPVSSLEAGDTIILLLETNGLWENSNSSTLAWNCRQFVKAV